LTYLLLGIRAALATTLAVSLVAKLLPRAAFADFERAVGAMVRPLRAHTTAGAVAAAVAELVCVALLIVPAATAPGLALALALLGFYTILIVDVLRREQDIACHCFGSDATPVSRTHLVRNGSLMAFAIAGLVLSGGRPQAGRASAEVLSVVAGAVCGVIVSRWDDLDFLVRSNGLPGMHGGSR
jgi:hypothetical protein